MTATFDWSEQHVIVTGGSGFLGSYVVEELQQYDVASIVVPRSNEYDLREKEANIQLFEDNPDTTLVIHLAANVGGIGYNESYPGELFYDNIMMGTLILEQARQHRIPKFVGIGTVCAYPKSPPIPFEESSLWDGYPEETNAPYGLAKKMLLVQSQAYRQQYGYNAIHLLPTNLYGPRDDFSLENSHVMAALIRRFYEATRTGKDEVVLWGDGSPTREYLHARDAARAIILAAMKYNSSDPMNIAGGTEVSIKELADLIAEMVGYEGRVSWDTSRPNGQPRRKVDASKIEAELGFTPAVDFKDGVQETIDWYKVNHAKLVTE
jgi:GDP-L-fucose synthase